MKRCWRRRWHPLQCSCLENPRDGGAWWAAVHGVAESRTRLSDFTFTSHFRALEKEMAAHFSVLAWRIPGTGEPGGLLSMGSHRVGHDWSDWAAAAATIRWSVCFSLVNQRISSLVSWFLSHLHGVYFISKSSQNNATDQIKSSIWVSCYCSVTKPCSILCNSMDRSMPAHPVHH